MTTVTRKYNQNIYKKKLYLNFTDDPKKYRIKGNSDSTAIIMGYK